MPENWTSNLHSEHHFYEVCLFHLRHHSFSLRDFHQIKSFSQDVDPANETVCFCLKSNWGFRGRCDDCNRILSNNARLNLREEKEQKKLLPPGWIESASSSECRSLPLDTPLNYSPIDICDDLEVSHLEGTKQ